MSIGGPRFERAKSHYGIEPDEQEESDAAASDLEAVPVPIDDNPLRTPSSRKRNLEGEIIEPDMVIDLREEGAIEDLERFQDTLPKGRATDPTEPDIIPHDEDVTQEDEKELEEIYAAFDAMEKENFEIDPGYWKKRIMDRHVDELLHLHEYRFSDEDIENIMRLQVEGYANRYEKLSGKKVEDKDAYLETLIARYQNAKSRIPIETEGDETVRMDLPDADPTETEHAP